MPESETGELLFLIKDFVDEKIVFYWADVNDQPVSPYHLNLNLAEEWWLSHCFSQNKSAERRLSIHDRRKLYSKRAARHRSRHISSQNPDGRRKTDSEIRVDKDISRIKLLQFYSRNPHLQTGIESEN